MAFFLKTGRPRYKLEVLECIGELDHFNGRILPICGALLWQSSPIGLRQILTSFALGKRT